MFGGDREPEPSYRTFLPFRRSRLFTRLARTPSAQARAQASKLLFDCDDLFRLSLDGKHSFRKTVAVAFIALKAVSELKLDTNFRVKTLQDSG